MYRGQSSSPTPRQGMILLVVITLLTLFAVVGLAFVLYSESEASASRIYREKQYAGDDCSYLLSLPRDPMANFGLGQLIYDVPDDQTGIFSAMRGWSLARDMYSYNPAGGNTTPFNGTGRLHGNNNPFGQDDFMLVNHQYFATDGQLHDPERIGWHAPNAAAGTFTAEASSSYTYPDLNHMFLAAVKADGTLLVPSFYRPWNGPGGAVDWTSNNQASKYMVLRPRPAANENPTFPPLASPTGDVKNLPSGMAPDSIWMDLGAPVLTLPSGRQCKALYAFLVIDLDGKVNVNATGNVRGKGSAHLSNQGWGKWEINSSLVGTNAGEWTNLLLGGNNTTGRYGSDGQPGNGQPAPLTFPLPRVTGGLIDYDASNEGQGGVATGLFQYPPNPQYANTAPYTGPAYRGFPVFPNGYSNGSAAELALHPSMSSAYNLQGADSPFAASDLFNLLNVAGGANWKTSRPGLLCPNNFASARTRALVTTHSNQIDRPALTPWIFDLTGSTYTVQAGGVYGPHGAPQGGQIAFPAATSRNATPAVSEFNGADWRFTANLPTVVHGLGKVDLNRFLSPYPHQGSGTNWPIGAPLMGPNDLRFDASSFSTGATPAQVMQQFQAAQTDRQNLANDIYRCLLAVTGIPPVAVPATPTAAELAPRRWLAQLAANIVDFIDSDSISTPFNFYSTADGLPAAQIGAVTASGPDQIPTYWVFGTELPRVVLNEALVEYVIPPAPASGQGPTNFSVKTWVELFNPVPPPPVPGNTQPQDGNPVPLYVPGPSGTAAGAYSTHQVVLAPTNPAAAGTGSEGLYYNATNLNDNVLGTPYTDTQKPNPRGTTDFSGGATVPTVGPNPGTLPTSSSPQQFFLVGPASSSGQDAHSDIVAVSKGGSVPDATPWLKSAGMEYTAGSIASNGNVTWTADDRTNGLAVLLRRLANPHLPPNPNPLVNGAPNPAYNPWVTTDYLRGVVPNNASTTTSPYASVGKKQPYNSATNQVVAQTQAVPKSPIFYTFGQQNVPVNSQFDWLVHLDRQLISPMELLHVSAYHPHELLHRFIPKTQPAPGLPVNVPVAGHRAPWYDPSTRLYRAFEFLGTHDRAWGSAAGGRVPGMININTIWDPETFNALCDPQAGNSFNAAQVSAIYQAMLQSRTANGSSPGPGDRPFQSMGFGNESSGSPNLVNTAVADAGINDTFLRAGGTGRLFDVPGANLHPYQQTELMNKIFNQVSTRSNVFAVWCTIGFFQVTNAAAQPPTLGPEIGTSCGTVRRQFFSIVDRTNLTLNPTNPQQQGPQPWFTTGLTTVPGPGAATVAVPTVSGSYEGTSFNLAGTTLVVDVGDNQETVTVSAVNTASQNGSPSPPNFTATFAKPHAAGFPISNVVLGNPGPQPKFNYRSKTYAPVVRYFTFLQ
jgi:hypothetical protein